MPNECAEAEVQEDKIASQYRYIKELAQLIYEVEEKRERNLIQQASQMQTAFSFMIAAIFMAVPAFVEFFGEQSKAFFYTSAFSILTFLLISLLLAAIAQWRWKSTSFIDIPELKETVLNSPNWEEASLKSYQNAQYVDWIGTVQVSRKKLNERRVYLIMASMICLYISVAILIATVAVGALIF